jgi:threonine synthase
MATENRLAYTPEKKLSLRCHYHGVAERNEIPWACPKCGSTLRAVPESLDGVNLSAGSADRPFNLFRFDELLPVRGDVMVGKHTGWTPLMRAEKLGARLGLGRLYLKLDCYNWPTYSYKDRVVASALQRALETGADTVACVSTGNVGNSVAALAAAAGIKAVIFYPAGIEPAKNLMSLAHGACVIQLDGTFDDVNKVCRRLALETDVPFVNLTLRPYYAEGAKTVAYEVVEQLGWVQPEHVVVPTAGAALLTRVAYGFEEMAKVGSATGPVPRIHAAQARGCAPIANAFAARELVHRPVVPDTLAKSIAIGNPSDGAAALEVIAETGGSALGVPDEEILEGIRLLAVTEGIFTEPAGGAAIAMTRHLARTGVARPDDIVVAVISGSGLKTQQADDAETASIIRGPAEFESARSALLDNV